MKRKIENFHAVGALLFCVFLTAQCVYADENAGVQAGAKQDDYFAIVGQQTISTAEYVYRFKKALRQKFFHGKVSQEELDTFKTQVDEQLISEVLLAQEARRRGLHPDANKVAQELDKLDKKFSNAESAEEREDWEEKRTEILSIAKVGLERESLVQRLREQVMNVAQPPLKEVKQYYEDNKDKFTEPQQWDVSIILLLVDPSSSSEVWEQTVEKAEKLLEKIHEGESFEELARIHSGDESAVDGGHMGYMHLGMFGAPAQKVLNVLEPGDVSEPVVLLEGVALFRINAIKEADLNNLEEVEERARNLLMRELGAKAWKDLRAALRQSADVKYNELMLSTKDSNVKMNAE
jgi:parvulin-like peptidyl-prolyl isomerase